jgi:hypothetical protein
MFYLLVIAGLGFNLIGCSGVLFSDDSSGGESKALSTQQTAEACFQDTFEVPANPNLKPVDILFVLETSASMMDIRQSITNGINGFVNDLPANTDFNIAVMLSHGSTSMLSGKLYRAEAEPIVLKTSELSKADIQIYLTTKLMQAPAHADSGGGEEGVFSLFNGITNTTLLADSQAAGFFRANAALGVVFIADRRDICAVVPVGVPPETDPTKVAARIRDCEGLTAAGLANRLTLLKGMQPLQVSGIIYADNPAPAGKELGYGYSDVIALKPGQAIDIANDNIAAGLAPLAEMSGFVNGQNVFTPSHSNIDPATLKVTVNGQEVPFTYNGEQVTITVSVTPGSTVMISYCLAGDNPFVGVCKVFENAAQLDMLTPADSTEDLQLENQSGGASVDAVRNLSINNISGGFTVQSAMAISSIVGISGENNYIKVAGDIGSISTSSGTLRIDKAEDVGPVNGISGTLQLNAQSLTGMENSSGDACLRIKTTIGKIQSMSGQKTIIASRIEELSVVSGEIHIYEAQVQSVNNISGRICLHNGATVVNATNVVGFIGACN